MGQKQGTRVVTLNYSGIYLSPFEFYAMDNWQELEKIGIIFEEHLKQDYLQNMAKAQQKRLQDQKLKSKKSISTQNNGKQQFSDNYYIREKFDWKMNQLQKQFKNRRLSPLYDRWQQENQQKYTDAGANHQRNINYAGIYYQDKLMDRALFHDEWEKRWKQVKKNIQEKYNQTKNKDLQPTQQRLLLLEQFDFNCYRALVEYIYNFPQRQNKIDVPIELPKILADDKAVDDYEIDEYGGKNLLKFSSIVGAINNEGDPKRRKKLVDVYRKFMGRYFHKINQKQKIETTCKLLLEKWDFDVVFLQEVNQKFRKNLWEKIEKKYFLFGPVDKQGDEQCITLVKKTFPLLREIFIEALQDSIKKIRQTEKLIKQSINQIQFYKYKLEQQEKQYFKLSNSPKINFDLWFKNFEKSFNQYWKDKKKDKSGIDFQKDVKANGLFHWTKGFTLTTFQAKQLQNKGEPIPVILGNFHLSSKQTKNRMQMQTLGILVYKLHLQGYKMILGGDFNSHIVICDKDNTESLFALVKYHYKIKSSEQQAQKQIKKVAPFLHIFPKHPMIITTKKKRTILQVQVNKTNELKESCIDQIITNFTIDLDNCYSGVVNGVGSGSNQNQVFIPTNEHPYDHFLVEARIDIQEELS